MKSNADKLRELAARARVFLLDMDGTLYLGDTLIGDMRGTLRALRAAGKRAVYCTNNSSKTAKEYVAKLSRLGLWEEGDLVYTSGMAAAELTYEKLVRINRMIVEGKPYIATHADDVCPAEGVYPPDAGSFIQLLYRSSGRLPDVVCGKPDTVMGRFLLARRSRARRAPRPFVFCRNGSFSRPYRRAVFHVGNKKSRNKSSRCLDIGRG